MYQKCPVCFGTGKDQNVEALLKFSKCNTCKGSGIINELTGLPPENYNVKETPEELASRLGFPNTNFL